MSTKIKIVSNTSGIRLEVGNANVFMFTTEAAELIDSLQKAMARCGEWSVPVNDDRNEP
jgi:hypothetical protein